MDSEIKVGNINGKGDVIVGNGNTITNIYQSIDYNKLIDDRAKFQTRVSKYPEDSDFKHELAQILKDIEDFQQNVIKLAEDFQRVSINTERLKLAYQHFKKGDFSAARAALDAKAIKGEQHSLLEQQSQLADKQAELST